MENNNKMTEKKSKEQLKLDAQKIQRAINEFCEEHSELIVGTHLIFACNNPKQCDFSFLIDDKVLERDYTS